MQTPLKIGMVDDITMLRKGVSNMLANLGHHIVFGADNGVDLQRKIDKDNLPDVILMDVNMPEMDGFESTAWMREHFPSVRVIAFSMSDSESSIIRMFRNGARGYILKDATPQEFALAFNHVLSGGLYYHDKKLGRLPDAEPGEHETMPVLDDKELRFLRMICSELTWKEIAKSLDAQAYIVDESCKSLFDKVHVSSRIGLLLFAIRHQLI